MGVSSLDGIAGLADARFFQYPLHRTGVGGRRDGQANNGKSAHAEVELDPQNPNPRGAHNGESETDPLDDIIRTFNERWFQGWSATPEEQRVKLVNISESVKQHPDFATKYENNPDPHNKDLAFEKIFKEVMLQRRKDELDLYKLFATDGGFSLSMVQTIQRMVAA